MKKPIKKVTKRSNQISLKKILDQIPDYSLDDLMVLHKKTKELINKKNTKYEVVSLFYNRYKGSGKCWIAIVDSETKKILKFLDQESVQKETNSKGYKIFKVPLIEEQTYLFNESGSKSSDERIYYLVERGKLVELI